MESLAISEMTTYRWSFEEDVHNYKAAGVQGIGVWRQKLSDFGEERGVELIRDSGMAVSSLLWAGGFTGSEGKSHKESIEDAKEAIKSAESLKAGCLILYTGARSGHTHNHARRLIRSALAEISPLAQQAQVTLAIEPMHIGCATDWTFLTEIDETLEFIESLSGTPLKLAFDTYHLGHDEDILARIAELLPHIAIVQLGDAKAPPDGEQNRCPLGEGAIPLKNIVRALDDAGYDGFYEIELLGEDTEASGYNDLIRQSKKAIHDMLGVSPAP